MIVILLIVSIVLVTISIYRRNEKLLVFSGFILFFTIFNLLARDTEVFKPIITLDRREVFESLVVVLYVQIIIVAVAVSVSVIIPYILWILFNKQYIDLKPFLTKYYKLVSVILVVYISLSIIVKEVEIMWLSIWYLIYFFFKGAFSRKSKVVYIHNNIQKNMLPSFIVLLLTILIFSFIHYNFIIEKKHNVCNKMSIKDYNNYLKYNNFLNYRKKDYEREYHKDLRLNLILYNRECKKYSKKEEDRIDNNFVIFTKYQIDYNKRENLE